MTSAEYVGSLAVRVATLAVVTVYLVVVVADNYGMLSASRGVVRFGMVAGAIVAFIGVIYSSRTLYPLWMRVTKALHNTVVTLLFGGCYLFFIPVFFLISWVWDPLNVRNPSGQDTFWIRRRTDPSDPTSFQRLG